MVEMCDFIPCRKEFCKWPLVNQLSSTMSRGSTPRHAQTAGDLGFAVQFNAETQWHFAQLRYPWVG